MLLHCGLLLLFLNCVKSTEYVYDYALENSATKYDQFSYWPSTHNAMQMMRLRKREAPEQTPVRHSEGGDDADAIKELPVVAAASAPPPKPTPVPTDAKNKNKQDETENQDTTKAPETTNVTTTAIPDKKNSNVNVTTKDSAQLDIAKPGVLMRGVIVFGGFLLLGVAYFIFYRGKMNKSDASNIHNINDGNQFRYGVLQSEDRRDNLELSRIPLTMESDDDDDEDLEIFDLEQKRKSLSYVNLQTNDEEIVFNNSSENSGTNDKDNLLLDIEDASSDTLMNWSNNEHSLTIRSDVTNTTVTDNMLSSMSTMPECSMLANECSQC